MDTSWLTPLYGLPLYGLPWHTAGQIVLAALLGGMIGFERAWHGHPAGLRTNSLVAVGACLFTILSITAFPVHGSTQDTARIAAQIVSGIGFIGGGVLLQSKNRIRGITTAATIWLVAAIGMGVGAGLYFLAIFTTVFSTAILVVLHPVSGWLLRRARQNRVKGEGGRRARELRGPADTEGDLH
ncbi:MAG: MgtC/SapB family protein [Chloroflexota bacterium]|nr:MgtC/SapB family protein [Chloroflexota bacterium]